MLQMKDEDFLNSVEQDDNLFVLEARAGCDFVNVAAQEVIALTLARHDMHEHLTSVTPVHASAPSVISLSVHASALRLSSCVCDVHILWDRAAREEGKV